MSSTPIKPAVPLEYGQSEEEKSCYPFRLYYSWITPLIGRGSKAKKRGRPIGVNELLTLPSDEAVLGVYDTFQEEWLKELANPTDGKLPNLKVALRRGFGTMVYVGVFMKLISDATQVCIPLVLQALIKWIVRYSGDPVKYEHRMWEGYMICVALFFMQLLLSFTMQGSIFLISKAFSKTRTAAMMAIFDKTMSLNGQHGLTGKISQMHSTDCSKFIETSMFASNAVTAPFMIAGAVGVLYVFIGPAAFVGLGVAIITVPMQAALAQKMGVERFAAARYGDKRLGRISEFVQGIRIIKFMSWEEKFEEQTERVRNKEVDHFESYHHRRSLFLSLLTYAPFIISLATFGAAYGMGNDIKAEDIFPAFAMLNVLRAPLSVMPLAISKLVDLNIALNRMNSLVQIPDRKPYVRDVDEVLTSANRTATEQQFIEADVTYATKVRSEGLALYIPHASVEVEVDAMANNNSSLVTQPNTPAMTENTKTMLKLMTLDDLKIEKGKLTLVIGSTASGKSLLINTLVGEQSVSEDTRVYRDGTVAYVAQEAWIMNETLKNNILMSKEYEETKYKSALLSCQLKSDLDQLPASDKTEIGERGINLSGGQKQRVAFARAVYSDRDVVLMDDPLSAVDPHVCGALFHGCIRGALAGRTRVLVTHQQQFLKWADRIIVVDSCAIAFNGTYGDLMQRPDMMQHVSNTAQRSYNAATAAGQDDAIDEDDEKYLHLDPKLIANWTVPLPIEAKADQLMTTETVEGSQGWSIFLWYNKLGGVWNVILFVFLFCLFRAEWGIADFILTWWTSRQTVFGHTFSGDQYLMWWGILIGIGTVLVIVRMVPFVWATIRASRQVHGRMVTRLLHAPMSFFDTNPTGRIINRFAKDVETIDSLIPETLTLSYHLTLVVLGVIVTQAIGAWYMPLVYLGCVIIFAILFRSYIMVNHDVKALEAATRSPVMAIMNEALGGLPTIRAYGMVENYVTVHARRLELMNRPSYCWRNLQRWLAVRIDALGAILIAAVGMLSIAVLSSQNRADRFDTLPSMTLGITYAVNITGALGFLTTGYAEVIAAFSSVERCREYAEHLPQERTIEYTNEPTNEPPKAHGADATASPFPAYAAAPPESWPTSGSVTFEKVSLRYRPGLDLVLKDVSFTVKGGEKVGVVGRTGSGKSTIMLSLFRMLETAKDTNPEANRIVIDGVDIAHLKLPDLRRKITIIPQDPVLFAGTIRSNLDPFNEQTDEAIWAVLAKAKMNARVEQEDLGLECTVADRGNNFSAGERQLLCLARALLKNCKILLLDEATASIDPHHDSIVQETIRSEFRDRTVLTIAHRLGTIIDSDKVLVLDHGVVKEFGSPWELLQTPGSAFAAMLAELGPEEGARLSGIAKQKAHPTSAQTPRG
jgi:ATP-binding cassette subfamily C (CFTR/MRP) protein 1